MSRYSFKDIGNFNVPKTKESSKQLKLDLSITTLINISKIKDLGIEVKELIKTEKKKRKVKEIITPVVIKLTKEEESKILSKTIDDYYALAELLDYDLDMVAGVINYECKLNKIKHKKSRIKSDLEYLRIAKYHFQIVAILDKPIKYLRSVVLELEEKERGN